MRYSLYQVQDSTTATGDRFLLWTAKGTWATEPGYGGVPYLLSSAGLSDAEFWQMANSLHPIQR